MKKQDGFLKNAWYGFAVTAILIGALAGSVWGMAKADERTRAVGFGDADPAIALMKTETGVTLKLFDREITL